MSGTVSAEAIDKIEALAQKAGDVVVHKSLPNGETLELPFAAVPKGINLVSLKDYLEPKPSAGARFEEPDSFVGYVNRFKDGRTMLGVVPGKLRFQACIDYHSKMGDASADHQPCQHFAALELVKSPELKSWEEAFGRWVDQMALAEWLEDHAHEVSSHSASDILTIARELEATRNVDFSSVQRESDGGWNISYKETTSGKAGDLDVPGRIKVQVSLFAGGELVEIECLLRWKLHGDSVNFMIRPLRLEEALREAVSKIRDSIAEKTGLFVHVGDIFHGLEPGNGERAEKYMPDRI